nr:hypothetical protein [Tanacetum cinerariifolium]
MLSKPVEKTKRVSLAPGVIPGPSSGARISTRVVIVPDTLGMGAAIYCLLCQSVCSRDRQSSPNPGLTAFVCALLPLCFYFSYPPFESLIMSLGESDDLVLLDVDPAGFVLEADLHQRVVPEGMTMNTLPNDALGLYAHHFQQGGLRVPFSSFFLKDSKGKGNAIVPSVLTLYILSMTEFLKLPNFKGCKITAGALLPAGMARVTHLANPTTTLEDIPPKTVDMTMAEIPCRRVLDDKEKKMKKAEKKATANSPTVEIQVKVRIDKGAGKDGPHKKQKVKARPQVQPISEHVSSHIPQNHAEPLDTLANEGHVSPYVSAKRMGVLRTQTDEHITPRANIDEDATREEAHGYANANLADEGHRDNEEGCQHPEAVEKLARDKVVPDEEAKLAKVQAAYDRKVSDHDQLSKNYEGTLVCEKSAQERLEELEEEKKEPDQLNAKHLDRIHQLKEALKQSEADVDQLRREKEHYAVEAGRGETVRQMIINQYLPTFVRWLHQSAEYKRSLGKVFSLSVGKGFIDEISIGRKDVDIQAILKVTPEVDPTYFDVFIGEYEKLFDQMYPYVDKVARMYLLDPSSLQNIMPDETGPTPGGGLVTLQQLLMLRHTSVC